MPTSSSAHRSLTSGATACHSESHVKSRGGSGTTAKPSSRNTRAASTKDDSSAAVIATAEIIEKATLPLTALTTRDALTVWKALGLYLSDQLVTRHRVISIDRFAVFGTNDAGEAVFLHSSVFLRSNRLKESVAKQGLRGQPALAANAEPMSKVNTTEIGQEYLQNCGRELVESVITNVIAYVGKMAKQGRAMRLSMLPLGEWQCSGEKAAFCFLPEFQQQMIQASRAPRKSNATKLDEVTQAKNRKPSTGVDEMKKQEEKRAVEESLTPQKLEAHTVAHHDESRHPREASSTSTLQAKESSRTRRTIAWGEEVEKMPSGCKPKAHRHTEARSLPTAPDRRDVVDRVKANLIDRCGDRGLHALQRVLSLMDTSGDGQLTPQELKFGLRDLGIELSAAELRQVVGYFDRDGDGVVSLEELLDRLRGRSISDRRCTLILKAFDVIDQRHRRVVSLDDLRDNYDVSLLPRVRAGKKTKAQAMAEFLREWETSADHNNGITRNAFLDYYHNVSACVPDDSDFELLMRQTWHVVPSESEPESDSDEDHDPMVVSTKSPLEYRKNEQARPALPMEETNANTSQWKYLEGKLLPPNANSVHVQPTLDDMCRRLGANRVWGDSNESMNTRAFANALCILDRQLQAKDAQQLARLVADACSSGSGDSIALGRLYQCLKSGGFGDVQAAPQAVNGSVASNVIERIRSRLLQRLQSDSATATSIGLNALSRTLRLLDSNNDKRLSKDELKVGLRKLGVDINFHELDHLFTCLDADRSGCIDTNEFLVAMRGDNAMNCDRLKLVHMAFDRLDRDRDGSVTLDELSKAYDTSKHLEVLAGRMTRTEALRQFAQQWDTDTKDGMISRHEFETYYRNVSACVDRDDYFELMMRNAWHISGGTGQSANTSNRRVLVTKADGSQSVEEVKDDLGIRASDTDKIRQSLMNQGIHPVEVAMYSRMEDKTTGKPTNVPPGSLTAAARATTKPTSGGRSMGTMDDRRRPPSSSAESSTQIKRHAVSDFFAPRYDSSTDDAKGKAHRQRTRERQQRERAALMIQAQFRGFKCRKFIDCVRRQMAAEEARKRKEQHDQQDASRRGFTRAALKSYYGF